MKQQFIQWQPKGRTHFAEDLPDHIEVKPEDLSFFYGDTADVVGITESALLARFEGRSMPMHAVHFVEPMGTVYLLTGKLGLHSLRHMCGFGGWNVDKRPPAQQIREILYAEENEP